MGCSFDFVGVGDRENEREIEYRMRTVRNLFHLLLPANLCQCSGMKLLAEILHFVYKGALLANLVLKHVQRSVNVGGHGLCLPRDTFKAVTRLRAFVRDYKALSSSEIIDIQSGFLQARTDDCRSGLVLFLCNCIYYATKSVLGVAVVTKDVLW